MKFLSIAAALALAAGAAFSAVTAVHGQEGTQTPAAGATGTPTGDDGTGTPTTGTPTTSGTATPVGGGSQLPGTGTGTAGESNAGIGLAVGLIGLTLLFGAGAYVLARNRA